MRLINTEDNGRYLKFTFEDEVSRDEVIASLKEVGRVCEERNRSALVDFTRTSGTVSGMERFEIVSILAPNWNRQVRLSVALTPEQGEIGHFGELVAQNRGFRVRVFDDLPGATAWIERVLEADGNDD